MQIKLSLLIMYLFLYVVDQEMSKFDTFVASVGAIGAQEKSSN